MMNMEEYLVNIRNNQGDEAWEEENDNLWSKYREEVKKKNGAFINYCKEKSIDLTACSITGTPIFVNWVCVMRMAEHLWNRG